MERVELSKEKLCTLRGGLPRGAQKIISDRLRRSLVFVNRVLNGHVYDDKVIKAAYKLYDEEMKRKEAIIEIINQL
jgi:hypothetical protein